MRNYVGLKEEEQPPYDIYVKERAVLNNQHDKAYQALKPDASKADKKKTPDAELTRWMCHNFYDIRAFGAVMTTDVNCGQVRGPIQLVSPDRCTRSSPTASPSPVAPSPPSGRPRSRREATAPWAASLPCLTGCAACTATASSCLDFRVPWRRPRRHAHEDEGMAPEERSMTRRYVNPHLADGDKGTGFSDGDLDLFKDALDRMFEFDRSAARGNMRPVACIAFRHDSKLGNARADRLFQRVTCAPKEGVQPLPGRQHGQVASESIGDTGP